MNTITKRLLSMLVVMAMVLSMSPVITLPAAAAVTNPGAELKATVDAWETANASKFDGKEGNVENVTCPICGGNQTWEPLTANSHSVAAGANHHYYLPAAIELANTTTFLSPNSNYTVCLYMNKNITTTGNIQVYGTLNMFGNGTYTYQGGSGLTMFEFVSNTTALNIYSGTYTNTSVATTYSRDTSKGTAPSLGMIAPFASKPANIYGGTFNTGEIGFYRPWDAGSSVLNIYGGTINGGSKSVIDLSVKSGTVNMYAGTINAGVQEADNGAAVKMTQNGKINLYGGTISGGQSKRHGANVYMTNGAFTMSGGEITGGKVYGVTTNGWAGGNLYQSGGSFTMTGGKITKGESNLRGGNVALHGGTFSMTGGEIAEGNCIDAARYGGNIYTAIDITIGGTAKIRDGIAAGMGGNIYADGNKTVTLKDDAQVYGGTTVTLGGIYLAGATLNMSGNTKVYDCTGGKVGNIYVNTSGTLNMSGNAQIYGGTGTIYSAVYVEGGTMTMADNATVTANASGQAVHIERKTAGDGASLTMSGSASLVGNSQAVRVYAEGDDTLTLADGWAGALNLYHSERRDTDYAAGDSLPALYVTQGAITGTVEVEISNPTTETVSNFGAKAENGALVLTELAPPEPEKTEKDEYAEYEKVEDRVNAWVANNSGETFTSGYCPVCNEMVTWEAVSAGDGNEYFDPDTDGNAHRYLSADYAANLGWTYNDGTVCFYLNGKTLTTGKVAVRANLSIIAGEGGKVVRPADKTSSAFMFEAKTVTSGVATVFNLFGGEYTDNVAGGSMIELDKSIPVNVYGATLTSKAGNVYTNPDCGDGSLNLYSGAVINGSAYGPALKVTRGDVNMYDGATINGGVVTTSKVGGASVSLEGNCTFNMYGGKILNGASQYYGGNISITAGTFNMKDGEIAGGHITSGGWSGGNVYVKGGAFKMEGGKIYNGTSDLRGGNISAEGGTLTITGGEVYGGTTTGSARSGGNIYTNVATNISNAEIYNGTASGHGGNIYADGAAVVTMTNCEVYGGEAAYDGDQIRLNGADLTVNGGTITTADGGEGNAIYVVRSSSDAATLTLSGDATVVAENNPNQAILVYGVGSGTLDSLHIAADWTGTAYVEFRNCGLGCGDTVPAGNGTCDAAGFAGELYIRGIKGYGVDGKLVFASALKVVTSAGEEWFLTNAEALAAYKAAEGAKYLKMADSGEFEIDCDITLDVAGRTATVNGAGKVYLLDSANDDYEGNGYIKPAAGVKVQTEAAANGNRYVAIADEKNAEGGYYSAHRIEIKLTAVTLRPGRDGLYYKSAYTCDDKLASRISAYGVIANADHMPGVADMQPKVFSALTGFAPDADTHTVAGTSASVFGILRNDLKEGALTNAERANIKIYANAYFAVDVDGTADESDDVIVLGDVDNVGKKAGVGYSLMDIMQYINDNWAAYVAQGKADLIKAFIAKWEDDVKWSSQFTNIA